MEAMIKRPYLKIGVLGISVIILPFVTGILLGKVTDNKLVKQATIGSISAADARGPIILNPVPNNNQQVALVAPTEPTTASQQPTLAAPTQAATPAPQPSAPAPTTPAPAPKAAATTPQVKASTTTTAPAPAPKPAPLPVTTTCSGSVASQFVCLLNQYRAEKGLGKVSLNSALSEVARGHSAWMNETGIFSHTGINGTRLADRCKAAGITCRAENLAEGLYTAQALLDGWKASAGHNKNLLGPYSLIGFAQVGSYVTTLFN